MVGVFWRSEYFQPSALARLPCLPLSPSQGVAVLTGSRLCLDGVFPEYSYPEYPAPGFSSLMRPTPGMHTPAKDKDHAWIEHDNHALQGAKEEGRHKLTSSPTKGQHSSQPGYSSCRTAML